VGLRAGLDTGAIGKILCFHRGLNPGCPVQCITEPNCENTSKASCKQHKNPKSYLSESSFKNLKIIKISHTFTSVLFLLILIVIIYYVCCIR
jgi:hypothetical protein